MGGAKKKSMAQMEKSQVVQDKKSEASKKSKGKSVLERKAKGISIPSMDDVKIIGELRKTGAITPTAVASQFNIRVGVAKDLIEDLERRKLVKLVGGNSRIRVYQVAAA